MQIFKVKADYSKRIWELDLLRGFALIMMVYFHVIFDMKDIFGYNVTYASGINYYIGKVSAILFIFISGVSSTLSTSNVKRAFKIIILALLVTVASYLFSPGMAIKFGILHFLGVCVLLGEQLKKLHPILLVIAGITSIIFGNYLSGLQAPNNYLSFFGYTAPGFISADYYPVFPWIGVFMFGIAAGKVLYKSKISLLHTNLKDNPINFAGRNTLPIYVLHQPIIIGVLKAIQLLSS